MSGGGILLGLGIGAALVGIAYALSHAIANAELAIDDMFGDWPHLSEEMAVTRKPGGGAGYVEQRPLTDDVRTHRDGEF